MGTVSIATKLKFEVFDVYDRMETKVCPIGAAHCDVMGLLRAPDQSQRHEILFDGAVCGYLTIRATKVVWVCTCLHMRVCVCVYAYVLTCVCVCVLMCVCVDCLCALGTCFEPPLVVAKVTVATFNHNSVLATFLL